VTTFSLFFTMPEDVEVAERVHLIAPKHLVGTLVEDKPDDKIV
jgi:hypothetical protein